MLPKSKTFQQKIKKYNWGLFEQKIKKYNWGLFEKKMGLGGTFNFGFLPTPHTRTHTLVCNTHTHTDIYTPIYTHTYIHTHLYTHTPIYTHTHRHIHTHTHTHIPKSRCRNSAGLVPFQWSENFQNQHHSKQSEKSLFYLRKAGILAQLKYRWVPLNPNKQHQVNIL